MCFIEKFANKHKLMQCQRKSSQTTQKMYNETRRLIEYEKYSNCYQCELSQEICQRYEQRVSQEY